jgi:hypothetical protein
MKPNSATMIIVMNTATGSATHDGRLKRRAKTSARRVSQVIFCARCRYPTHSKAAITTPAATVNPVTWSSAAPPPSEVAA